MMVLNWIGRNPLKLVLSIVLVWMFWGPVFHFFIAPWANDLVYPDPKQTALDLAGVSIISVGNMVAGADPATDGLILTRYGERTKECDAKYDGECPNIVLTTEKLPIEIDPLAGHNLLILKDGRIVYTDINDARDSISFRIFNPDTGTTSTILTKPYIEFFDYDQKLASSTPVPPLDTMDQYIGFIGNTPLIEDTDEQGNIVIKFMDVVPAQIGDYKEFINEKSVKRLVGATLNVNGVSLEGMHTRTHPTKVIGEYPIAALRSDKVNYQSNLLRDNRSLTAQVKSIILNSTYTRTWCGLDIYDALSVIGGQFLGGPPDAKCNAITTFSLKELNDGVVGREIYSFGDLDTGRNYTKIEEDNVTVFKNINNHYLLTDKRLFAYKSIVSPDAELTHFIIPTLGDYLLATDGSRDTALVSVPGHIVSVRRVEIVK